VLSYIQVGLNCLVGNCPPKLFNNNNSSTEPWIAIIEKRRIKYPKFNTSYRLTFFIHFIFIFFLVSYIFWFTLHASTYLLFAVYYLEHTFLWWWRIICCYSRRRFNKYWSLYGFWLTQHEEILSGNLIPIESYWKSI